MEDQTNVVFNLMNGEGGVPLFSYIDAKLAQDPTLEIHVGCDSQNYRDHTIYATVVVFRYKKNGGHIVYRKERLPKIKDMWEKLWGETQRSADLAMAIRENCGIRVYQIDLDFNTNPEYPSHKLLNASQGYIKSLGFDSKAKPNLLMATWAANVLCH